jgi:enoyl-CoA hydratase
VNDIHIDKDGPVTTISIDRAHAKNALDGATVRALRAAFNTFDADESAAVAVLYGMHGSFCAGADLKEMADGANYEPWAGSGEGMLGAPMNKPMIGAVSGHAVAGGLGLALYCDIRIADPSAIFGVFCRRFGVPMSDGTTVRLPRLIGEARALDMMLTGRAVDAHEAAAIGLVREVVASADLLAHAQALALQISQFPPLAMRSDRRSLLESRGLELDAALHNEAYLAADAKRVEAAAGAARFSAGKGRHGRVEDT